MLIESLLVNGGIEAGKILMNKAAEDLLDWGSGKAWEIAKNKKQTDPICEDLYDAVEKCVLNAIRTNRKYNDLLKINSVTMACELIYKSIVETGYLDDSIYQKIKYTLQADSLSIKSKEEIMDSFDKTITANGKSPVLDYLMNRKLNIMNKALQNTQKDQKQIRDVLLTENQNLKLLNSKQSLDNSIRNKINDILTDLQHENRNVDRLYRLTSEAVSNKAECSIFYDFIDEFETTIIQIENNFNKIRINIPADVSKILDGYIHDYKLYFSHARYLVTYRDDQDDDYKHYYMAFPRRRDSLSIEKHKKIIDLISGIINS